MHSRWITAACAVLKRKPEQWHLNWQVSPDLKVFQDLSHRLDNVFCRESKAKKLSYEHVPANFTISSKGIASRCLFGVFLHSHLKSTVKLCGKEWKLRVLYLTKPHNLRKSASVMLAHSAKHDRQANKTRVNVTSYNPSRKEYLNNCAATHSTPLTGIYSSSIEKNDSFTNLVVKPHTRWRSTSGALKHEIIHRGFFKNSIYLLLLQFLSTTILKSAI